MVALIAGLSFGDPLAAAIAPTAAASSATAQTTHAAPTSTAPTLVLGEPLARALAAFRPLGVNVLSSSRVITRRHRVTRLPDPMSTPLAKVQALLAPHNLTLLPLSDSTWYVSAETTEGAQQSTDATPAEDQLLPVIEEVVVTASHRLAGTRATAQQLDAAELATLPSIGRDALRGIAHLPGVAGSGVSGAPRLRGGDNNEVLYLLDGVPLLAPFHLSAFHSLFSSVNSNVLSGIEVFTSGFAAQHGGKMSGLVALDLLRPRTAFEGAIDVNSIVASTHIAGNKGRVQWLASARHSTVNLVLDQIERDYGHPRFHDELAHLVWSGDRQTWSFGVLSASDQVELEDPTLDEEGESTIDYRSAWSQGEIVISDNLFTTINLSALDSDDATNGELDQSDVVEGELDKRLKYRVFRIGNTWEYLGLPKHQLGLGWQLERQDADYRSTITAEFEPFGQILQNDAVLDRQLALDRRGTLVTAYLQGSSSVSDVLQLDWGVRYSNQDIDPVHATQWDPRLQLTWEPNPTWALIADVGRYTQYQTLRDVQIDDGLIELQEPQRSDQISLTLQRESAADARWIASAYYRNIHDPWQRFDNLYNPWVLLPELHADRVRLESERARAWGAELLFASPRQQALNWSVSYAYSVVRERVAGRWHNRPWDQRHALKARAQYTRGRWQFGIAAIGRSGWPTTPFVSALEALDTQLYQDRLRSFWSLDVHIARAISAGPLQGEIYLDVTNASNRRNVGGFTYSERAEDVVRRTSKLLPVVPTLGVKLSF